MEKLTQKQLITIIAIGGVIIFVIGFYIYKRTNEDSYTQIEEELAYSFHENEENVENKSEEKKEEIVIHIAGQIKQPGIVRIQEGARIADIIEQAGGLTQEADISQINLAYIVEDGQKITIPSKQDEKKDTYVSTQNGEDIITESSQTEENRTKNKEADNSTNKSININKASIEELQTLEGIGQVTAERIIDYRKENGEFKQIEDIKNVPGIGEAKYNAIKDRIRVK